MSESDSEFGAFVTGFVIGGLVGAATALLLAPQSGAETRAQIATKSEEIKQAGEHQFLEYRDKAETAVSQAQTRVHDTSSQVQERARIVLHEGRSKRQKQTSDLDDTGVEEQQYSEGDLVHH